MKTNDVLKGLGVVGAALAAWFLLEPNKGAQRRRKIATLGRDLYDGAGQELGRLGGEIGRLGEDVGRGFTSIVDRVGEMTGLSTGNHDDGGSTRSRSGRQRAGGTRRRKTSRAHANGDSKA